MTTDEQPFDGTIDLLHRLEQPAAVRVTLPDGRLVLAVNNDGTLDIGEDILPAEFAAAVRAAFTSAPRQDADVEAALAELRALDVDDPAAWLKNAATLAAAGANASQVRTLARVMVAGRLSAHHAARLGLDRHGPDPDDLRRDGATDERIRLVRELYRMAADTPGPSAHTLARAALALSGVRTS